MGFTAKAKPKSISSSPSSSGENWGMGLLLVFFPEDNNTNSNANAIVDKSNKLSSSSSSSSSSTSSASSSTPSPSLPSSFKRNNSNNVLLSKAQSTISICALLVFITLLLFTLSTFEPSPKSHPISASASRRFLSQNSPPVKNPNFNGIHTDTNHSLLLSSSWLGKMWKQKQETQLHNQKRSDNQFALQRMGTLYRRGTRAMTDLVVGHVEQNVTEPELRLFVRLLHRSGLTARADVVFIFACRSLSRFASVIEEENQSFLKLVRHYRRLNSTTSRKPSSGFDVSQFIKVGKKAAEEPLWGRRSSTTTSTTRSNSSEEEAELTQLSYGSVVGFEVGELDPENSLAGFLDHVVPMSLRRWACYPMLLGRVRRNFKHIMLVDVKNSVVFGDPLGRVRHKSAESVILSVVTNKHCKKTSDPTQSHCPVNSAIITGGARGIRRMSSTVLTEIVRAAMQQQQQRKRNKNTVTESGILSQLVGNQFISKNINLVTSTESVHDPSSLVAASVPGLLSAHAVIQRGNSNHHDLNSIIMNQICSSEIDSSVYRDC